MECTPLPLRRLRMARVEIVPTSVLIKGRPRWQQLADPVIRTAVKQRLLRR